MTPFSEESKENLDGTGFLPSLQAAADGSYDIGSPFNPNDKLGEKSYSVARARENIRGIIALALIALLSVVVVLSVFLVWVHPDRSRELHDLLVLVMGPLTALAGSATGFYFGAKEHEQSK
jgi:hypothetical protein